jgi:hypothetical protein
MVGGEDHRAVEVAQVLASLNARPRERARERQNPGRLRQPPDDAYRPRAVPRREFDGLGDVVVGAAAARPAA